MARPSFTEVGKPSSQRWAFSYRRTFELEGAVPEVALAAEARFSALVRKARRGDVAAVVAQSTSAIAQSSGKTGTAELLVTMPNARLWSPDDWRLHARRGTRRQPGEHRTLPA